MRTRLRFGERERETRCAAKEQKNKRNREIKERDRREPILHKYKVV